MKLLNKKSSYKHQSQKYKQESYPLSPAKSIELLYNHKDPDDVK